MSIPSAPEVMPNIMQRNPRRRNRCLVASTGVIVCLIKVMTTICDRSHFLVLDDNSSRTLRVSARTGASRSSTGIHRNTSVDPQAHACNELPESIQAFTEALYDEPENLSFPVWQSSSNLNWEFPKFDMNLLDTAFGDRRLAFVGDSTTFYTLNTLHRILNLDWNSTDPSVSFLDDRNIKNTPSMSLSNGLKAINEETDRQGENAGRQIGQKYYPRNGAHVLWSGYRGSNMNDNCLFDAQVWPQIRQDRPDILVANWGLHMMHRGKTNSAGMQRPCLVHQFVYYETWLQKVLEIAKEVGTRVLLFKTTNHICDEKLPQKDKEDLRQMYTNTSSTFLRDCQDTIQERDLAAGTGYNFTAAQLEKYCLEGAMTDRNSQRLNRRMLDFVQIAKKNSSGTNLMVEIYNDHDMEHCDYTGKGDGLHYHKTQIPRIRMLAHMVNCLWQNDGGHGDTNTSNVTEVAAAEE